MYLLCAADPFNRQPLRIEQVEPDHDLRRRIKEWLDGKIAEAAAAAPHRQAAGAYITKFRRTLPVLH